MNVKINNTGGYFGHKLNSGTHCIFVYVFFIFRDCPAPKFYQHLFYNTVLDIWELTGQ
jgi:hypothetical protein